MNVAVAHQSHNTREKLAAALRARGLQVFSVPDGQGLLDAAEQAKLVLVLVEPKILRREKVDLRAQLRDHAGYHVQVVALTHEVTDEFAEVFQRHGATLLGHPVAAISQSADWVLDLARRLSTGGRDDNTGGHWEATGKDGGGLGARLVRGGTGPTILVVEDEPTFRLFVCDALGNEGYRVWSAANGEDALRCYEKEHVDLVIADVNMPGMDGFALKQRIDLMKKGETPVPFIIMTADSNAQNAANAAAVGVVFVLSKPIRNLDALYAIVKETLRKSGALAK